MYKHILNKCVLFIKPAIEEYKGYLNIIRSLGKDKVPVIAIGNIKTKDVQPLLEVGVHGVAVSSYFNENTENRIKEMLKILEGNYAFG